MLFFHFSYKIVCLLLYCIIKISIFNLFLGKEGSLYLNLQTFKRWGSQPGIHLRLAIEGKSIFPNIYTCKSEYYIQKLYAYC